MKWEKRLEQEGESGDEERERGGKKKRNDLSSGGEAR